MNEPTLDLDRETIDRYMETIVTDGTLVSYRHPKYPTHKPSLLENRFNVVGQCATYAASGMACAQAEVPNYGDRECFEITPGLEIHAFNLAAYARDHGVSDLFTMSKEDGGYSLPQAFASHLTSTAPVSAIIYESHALKEQGKVGLNLVILPFEGTELDAGFFKKKIET